MTTEELAALKDGDKVIVAKGGYGAWERVETIRVTATQIVAGQWKFDRRSGALRGTGMPDLHLRPYTPEAEAAIQERLRLVHTHREMLKALEDLKPQNLDYIQCARIHSAMTGVMMALAQCGLYDYEKVDKL